MADASDSWWRESFSRRVPGGLLAILRVYLGIVFLAAATAKMGGETSFAEGLPIILERLGESAYGFYRGFLGAVAIPYAGAVAGLVIVGEIVVAISLVAGVATRVGAVLAMVLTLNYMLLKGAWFWTPSSNDAAFFVIALVLYLGAAGRVAGVDALLAKRFPQVPLW